MVTGLLCNKCKPGYYNLSKTNPLGCSPCNCNSFGTINDPISNLLICNQTTGNISKRILVKSYRG